MHSDSGLYISVIVPAFNGAQTIVACLNAIRASAFKSYELIVVDDHSSDRTMELARPLADKLIHQSSRNGVGLTRNNGASLATGTILCFIDQDVLIEQDTLEKIANTFSADPTLTALTGILSAQHPNSNFYSQYKNLYMHYIYLKLPKQINFLYGSLYAVRRSVFPGHATDTLLPDTELGQRLTRLGHNVVIDHSLTVIHLKHYSLRSIVKNDFVIPFVWAEIFVKSQGWRQLSSGRFAHASIGQLASIFLVALILTSSVLSALALVSPNLIGLILIFWLAVNWRFLLFLTERRGWLFGMISVVFTFVDQFVMGLGILVGLFASLVTRSKPPLSLRSPEGTEAI